MAIIGLLALHYGGPHWSFPWWVWMLAILWTGGERVEQHHDAKQRKLG